MTTATPVRFRDAARDRNKRLRTRAHLVDCAITEFAARGIERTSVDDIASRAEVSHGTFYYHFSNKSEILEAVGRAVAAGFVEIADRRIRDVASGLERVAMATQVFIRITPAVPEWGWLVVHALADMGTFYAHISRGIRKDVHIGVRDGSFPVEESELLFASLLSVVGTAIRTKLEHPDLPGIEQQTAEMLLRMLGVPATTARELPRLASEKYDDLSMVSPGSVQKDLEHVMPVLLGEILGDE